MATEETINPNRKTAIIVGLLFIAATVSSSLSLAVLNPLLLGPDYLPQFSKNEIQVIWAVLLMFVDIISVDGISIFMYPILKQKNEALGGCQDHRGHALHYICHHPAQHLDVESRICKSRAPKYPLLSNYWHTIAGCVGLILLNWVGNRFCHLCSDIKLFVIPINTRSAPVIRLGIYWCSIDLSITCVGVFQYQSI